MRILLVSVAILLGFSIAGCGSPATVGGGEGEVPIGDESLSENSPAAAVHQFLTAVRAGDDASASKMLTTVARQKTAEYQMVVAPPGSDTASFKVGEVEMIGEEGAHVASFWTDIDAEGDKHTDTIIWMARKEGPDWRIAGMATRLAEDQPAVVLNFEEPEEMLERQQKIETQMSSDAAPPEKSEIEADTADRRQNSLRGTRRE